MCHMCVRKACCISSNQSWGINCARCSSRRPPGCMLPLYRARQAQWAAAAADISGVSQSGIASSASSCCSKCWAAHTNSCAACTTHAQVVVGWAAWLIPAGNTLLGPVLEVLLLLLLLLRCLPIDGWPAPCNGVACQLHGNAERVAPAARTRRT